jgi:hypothetical protein
LSDTTGQTGSRFVFEINADDDWIFRKTSTRDVKRYIDSRIIKGIPTLCVICLGTALLVAQQRGYLSLVVLIIAEASFIAGYYALNISWTIATPKMQKALFSDTPPANRRFDCAFDDDRIVIKIGLRETRLPWSAIAGVEDIQSMVIFWYQPTVGFFVPSRAFSDDAARIAFAAWAAARVQAAGMNAIPNAPA